MKASEPIAYYTIPYGSCLYGSLLKSKLPEIVTTISNGATPEEVAAVTQRAVIHFSLIAGFNPSINFDIVFANFSKVIMTASNYPGVYKSVFTTPPSVADAIQMLGRSNRNYTQAGFVVLNAVATVSTMHIQIQ